MSHYPPPNSQGGWQQPPPNPQYPPQGGYNAPPPQGQWNQPPPPAGYNQQPWSQNPAPYGAPPPNQYQSGPPQGPPPQGGYNQPWPQNPAPYGYQQPPSNPYGQGPPPNAPPYGASQNTWGAPIQPPQSQYGSPAPPAPGAPDAYAYGAAPLAAYGPPTQPSLGYGQQQTANLDMTRDIEALRKAMKGLGTDEKALIAVLAKKDPIQMNTLREQYNQRLMRDLIHDLEKETSGYFEMGLVQIARGPLASDCYTLRDAMKGVGTKEAALDDVLVGRSNADIYAIKTEYQRLFKKTLESDLRSDLSASTEQMFMMIIAARRAEDSAPVVPHEIETAITQLQSSMGNVISKNATQVCEILTSKNDAQLRAICQAYEKRFQTPLEKVVKSKFSGHMEDALLLLLARAQNRPKAEALRLEEAMAGMGTKDELLVQRVVRCHWDQNFMTQVKDFFKMTQGKDLVKRIEGETRGDYERLLVACVK